MTIEDDDTKRIFLWLGRLVWICIILASIAAIVLAAWGLCGTAVALTHGETWAQGVVGVLFTVILVLVFREIKRGG